MIVSSETLKDTLPLATPFVPLIIDLFVKPKLERFARRIKGKGVLSRTHTFEEYLARSYKKHSYVSILAFQNQRRLLSDIYIPLTLRQWQGAGYQKTLIDGYPSDLLPVFEKILISDTAGMGKSTLMKWMFLSCLEKGEGIPIFVELRQLKAGDTLVKHILNELNAINYDFDEELVLNLIKDGGFIFFLDGYDEVGRKDREKVSRMLNDFIGKTDQNLFMISSRPDPALASLPGFMQFDIEPLELKDAFSLIRKYDKHGEVAESIISKLEGRTLKSISEFLNNPLLVSLLYKSYDYKHTIPLKKNIFYRQVYDALFESHDLTKVGASTREKSSGLDIDDFHAVCRALGFITLTQGIEFDKDQLLLFIQKAKDEWHTVDFKASNFLNDLLLTVPLFTLDGNYYRWSHRSLQDYFAAQFILLDLGKNKESALKRMINSAAYATYANVIELYSDMDRKNFRRTVLYTILSDFLIHCERPIAIKISKEPNETQVNNYKSLVYGTSIFFFPKKLALSLDINCLSDRAIDILETYLNNLGFELSANNKIAELLSGDYLIYDVSIAQLKAELISAAPFLDLTSLRIEAGQIKSSTVNKSYYPEFFGLARNKIIIDGNLSTEEFLNHRFIQMFFPHSILSVKHCQRLKREIEEEIENDKSGDLLENL